MTRIRSCLGNEVDEDGEQRRLAGSGSARDQDVLTV